MRVPFLTKTVAVATLLIGHGVLADTLNLNFETTSAGVATNSTTANVVQVPGSYNYGHSVAPTSGNVTGTTFGFYDDYIFNIGAGQVDSITSTINLAGLLGITNLQVRLFNVASAAAPGTTGNPSGSLIQSWSNAVSCGTGCSGSVDVITPHTLTAGTYDLQVRGTTDTLGGSFSGVLNTAPVPLPAALPLLLSGFGLLGGMLRRRTA
jgi:hypothetical protein